MPLLGAGSIVGDYSGASFHRLRRDASRTLGVHRYRGARSANRGGTSMIVFFLLQRLLRPILFFPDVIENRLSVKTRRVGEFHGQLHE